MTKKKAVFLFCLSIAGIIGCYFFLFPKAKIKDYELKEPKGKEMWMLRSLSTDQKSIVLNICADLRPHRQSVPKVIYDHIADFYCFFYEEACRESDNRFFFENEDNPNSQEEKRIRDSGYSTCLRRAFEFMKEHPTIGAASFLYSPCSLQSLKLSFSEWHLKKRVRVSDALKRKGENRLVVEHHREKAEIAFNKALEAHKACLRAKSGSI